MTLGNKHISQNKNGIHFKRFNNPNNLFDLTLNDDGSGALHSLSILGPFSDAGHGKVLLVGVDHILLGHPQWRPHPGEQRPLAGKDLVPKPKHRVDKVFLAGLGDLNNISGDNPVDVTHGITFNLAAQSQEWLVNWGPDKRGDFGKFSYKCRRSWKELRIYFESSILHDPTVNKELYRVMIPLPHQVNTGTREILLRLCSKISQGEILRQFLESLLSPDNKIDTIIHPVSMWYKLNSQRYCQAQGQGQVSGSGSKSKVKRKN